MKSLPLCLFVSITVRILMIYVSTLVDSYFHIQYTDVDYLVITDGSKNFNPYNRETFRYSPIIAWLVIPNNYISQDYGKILFSCIDTICSYIMHLIILQLQPERSSSDEGDIRQFSCNSNILSLNPTSVVWLWALNPLSIVLSTRGSFDCISNLMLVMTMFHVIKKHFVFAGLWYGLFIHFRIYPIIYILVFLVYIFNNHKTSAVDSSSQKQAVVASLYFLAATLTSVFLCTLISYCLYGHDYIDNAILYHMQRVDFKHNFSLHFYYNYLFYDDISIKQSLSVLQFNNYAELTAMLVSAFTQSGALIILIAVVSFKYAHRNFIFALFLVTLVFVTFNRVITAQVGR